MSDWLLPLDLQGYGLIALCSITLVLLAITFRQWLGRRPEDRARRRLVEFRAHPTLGAVVGYELPRSGGVWMVGRVVSLRQFASERNPNPPPGDVEIGVPYDDGRWGYSWWYVDDIDAVFEPGTVLGRHEGRPQ